MKKPGLLISLASLSMATLMLGSAWLRRLSLPYNEQGRHFDAANNVVYDDGAITVYGVMAGICALAAIVTLFRVVRAWRR